MKRDARPKTIHDQEDAAYVCDACGEEIVVSLDLSAGSHQDYVEDCPVCCHPHVLHVDVNDDGQVRLWAEPEQDPEQDQD